jgi:hypothetical protein
MLDPYIISFYAELGVGYEVNKWNLKDPKQKQT